jgi:hypothetical protein
MTRHRQGRPFSPPEPRARLDDEQRAVAQRLQSAVSGWFVLWSYGQRAFTAYPCWSAPTGLVLTDSDPQRLLRAMNAAQAAQSADAAQPWRAVIGSPLGTDSSARPQPAWQEARP